MPIEAVGISDLADGNHNTFLGLLAETGLVALIPYLIIFYYMFSVGLRVSRNHEGLERDFSLVFLLVVTIAIAGAMVGDYRSGAFFNTAHRDGGGWRRSPHASRLTLAQR